MNHKYDWWHWFWSSVDCGISSCSDMSFCEIPDLVFLQKKCGIAFLAFMVGASCFVNSIKMWHLMSAIFLDICCINTVECRFVYFLPMPKSRRKIRALLCSVANCIGVSDLGLNFLYQFFFDANDLSIQWFDRYRDIQIFLAGSLGSAQLWVPSLWIQHLQRNSRHRWARNGPMAHLGWWWFLFRFSGFKPDSASLLFMISQWSKVIVHHPLPKLSSWIGCHQRAFLDLWLREWLFGWGLYLIMFITMPEHNLFLGALLPDPIRITL